MARSASPERLDRRRARLVAVFATVALAGSACGATAPAVRPRPEPATRASTRSASEIIAAGLRTCARLGATGVYCWGVSSGEQAPLAPTRVVGVSGAEGALAFARDRVCVLERTGALRCEGAGFAEHARAVFTGGLVLLEGGATVTVGQRQNERFLPVVGPTAVARPVPASASQGWRATAPRWISRGRLLCMHDDDDTQCVASTTEATLDDLVAAGLGQDLGCALRGDGHVVCWGPAMAASREQSVRGGNAADDADAEDDEEDEDDEDEDEEDRSREVLALRVAAAEVAGIADAVELAVGARHACARTARGELRCWGDNARGQLGDGTHDRRSAPVSVDLRDVAAIAAGDSHTCALTADDRVYCWGRNDRGQVGLDAAATTVRDVGLAGVRDVRGGASAGCALLASGEVHCWGGAATLVAGGGTVAADVTQRAPLSESATSISLSSDAVCARLAGGTVRCWGPAWLNGGLTALAGSAGSPVRIDDIAVARRVACARAAGRVACWSERSAFEWLAGVDDAIALRAVGSSVWMLGATGRVACVAPTRPTGASAWQTATSLTGGVALGRQGERPCVLDRHGEMTCDTTSADRRIGAGIEAPAGEGCWRMVDGSLRCRSASLGWPPRHVGRAVPVSGTESCVVLDSARAVCASRSARSGPAAPTDVLSPHLVAIPPE